MSYELWEEMFVVCFDVLYCPNSVSEFFQVQKEAFRTRRRNLHERGRAERFETAKGVKGGGRTLPKYVRGKGKL